MRLKDCRQEVKGTGVKFKLRHLHHHLKWAWQRAWRGYDDPDVWGCTDTMRDRLIDILEDYKKNRHCNWNVPSECPTHNIIYGSYYSTEWTDALIDTLLFHIKMSDEDYCFSMVYPEFDILKGVYDKEKIMRAHRIRKQNQDAAFELLKIFWDELWD